MVSKKRQISSPAQSGTSCPPDQEQNSTALGADAVLHICRHCDWEACRHAVVAPCPVGRLSPQWTFRYTPTTCPRIIVERNCVRWT
jgi:hypothetical protein